MWVQTLLWQLGSNAMRICLAVTCCCSVAFAQPADEFQQLAQQWVGGAVAATQSGSAAPLRFEVKVGKLDSRLKLAACARIEPYLYPGSRLWGNTRIGLQCADGLTKWSVSLPVTVSAFGTAWVIKGHVAPGSAVTEDDVVESQVDWAQEAAPVLKDKSLWLGQIATRTLSTGQTLRQGMVRPAQVFQAGTSVRVVAQGLGFAISSDAQALSAGVIGQVARVRMDNGRVASGVVLDGRTVRIEL